MGKETEENELDETGSQRASESEQVPDPEAQASDELQEALREKDQFRKMAQRAQADLINYRRRVEDDKADIRRNANSGLLLKVLSVNDDLERAVEHAPEGDEADAWLDGLRAGPAEPSERSPGRRGDQDRGRGTPVRSRGSMRPCPTR